MALWGLPVGDSSRLWSVLLLVWAARACCLPECAAGCHPLPLHSSGDGSAALDSGACYNTGLATGAPSLSVPASYSNSQSTWAPSAESSQSPPVLDLCNQVQSILLKGERVE